jgi:erythrin-vacuolar iron transport family protein
MVQAIDVERLSLRDALDLAILMELEARDRYEEFSHLVGGRYEGDASDVFRSMAQSEESHRQELAARRERLFAGAPSAVTLDQLDDLEAPDRGEPRVFMSPRQALAVALDSEEKARDYFDDALRRVKDPAVRALFQELRSKEEQHAALVRARMAPLPAGPDLEDDEADEPGSDPG